MSPSFSVLRSTRTKAAAVVLAAGSFLAFPSSALAGTVTVPAIDLGFDATDIADTLQGALVPFLVAAIAIGFAFFAVKLGVKWIKRWVS